jgi:hypothetical protein
MRFMTGIAVCGVIVVLTNFTMIYLSTQLNDPVVPSYLTEER